MQLFKSLKAKDNKQKKPQIREDRYGLAKSVKIADVKSYLQKEFDRAEKREQYIEDLEAKINDFEKLAIKYDAMLVVQEKTQARIDRQDKLIKKLRDDIAARKETEKALRAKITDITINAEKKLKAKNKKTKK